ncbi:MAG TPA: glycosyltransferase [Chryseosolibacter sp.]|nr:glycosyltransferase [Chryseosolibacter sp.]
MKVLMFGWEFPPHISGGLGTACAGLTRALENENVHVLFTIPKLHNSNQAAQTIFINASDVPIRQKKVKGTASTARGSKLKATSGKGTERKWSVEKQAARTVIEVPALLTAYTSPETTETSFTLQQWNYSFDSGKDQAIASPFDKNPHARNQAHTRYVKEPYAFSGTYGANLLEEVARYAQVGAEVARAHSFDVIHAHDWMTYPAAIAAKKISGKPLIVHVHATEVDRSGGNFNQQIFAIEKEGMRCADKVVAVSFRTKNIAIQHYHIDSDKIEVVHNGITPREKTGSVTSPIIGSPVVTFLGRITHQKGPMFFVEAACKVHQRFPAAHFIVAGSGDQLPQMIERIAQEKLSSNFHFTGFLNGDDIDRVWAMSNVYVMPSVSEPFGITPLEAIQAGVPVILSKQAGVGEVMNHAIKVDFWDCEALAEAICNVLRYRSLANTLRENGSREVKSITWNKAAKKITNLYYELSTKRKKRKKIGFLFSGSPAKKAAHAPIL